MTELVELVHVGAFGDEAWQCPFSHTKKEPKQLSNVMPPVDGEKTNNASTLGSNLAEESEKRITIDVDVTVGKRTTEHKVQYTPHHLIPGNESWPETKLLRWVDSKDGHITGDIGYDVNHATNGVDLPGIHGIGNTEWSAKSPRFQTHYSFAAMSASRPMRQFHDRHPKYSSYVVNVLDAIAEKLDKDSGGATPGCGKDNCGGKKKKPFDPPFNLVTRLNGVALRLEALLTGSPRGWRKPVFTSRFALMYKKKDSELTQDEAREEISSVKT